MTRVTLGKSRVREIRPPGSVRAKPNGIATRPRPNEQMPELVPQLGSDHGSPSWCIDSRR
ncbi:hypothetical protein CN067_34260 [Sinorhizobium meliloti]|nr:hypothetical protein CN111_27270 [Sinorhizobium meliloti]RVQ09809.1 hypothetical protein CN067_34260 [Sinorhizobium meliloti]RVQ24203.1 hypothetical protein CN062_30660 [Sinorhizobium meliloti]RVQ53971.1 hypothetical protein CN060_25035 [Sinorhizobium meliloti]